MNEQKLLKRKAKARNEHNKKVLSEICRDLAILYHDSERPKDALREYKEEVRLHEELGSRMEVARCHRMMCEIYIDLDDYDKALRHGDVFLSIAKELGVQIEEQRALATLGRAFLHQGENKQISGDSAGAEKALKSSEKTFVKSLVLCESLKGKISKHELADMRARLLLNIGIVSEHLDRLDKAIDFLHKSQNICKGEDIFDVLHRCYITEGSLHLHKKNDVSSALSCFNKALDVAGRLTNKVQKQCETLSLKAKALCKIADYQSAKFTLLKAWKLSTSAPADKDDIEKSLKLVAAMCYTEDLLLTTECNDHSTLRRLCEKMGDGACYFQCYDRAINFYLKMLDHAEKKGEYGKQLIPCYISLSQTYKDMGAYDDALIYFRKEYSLNVDNPKEAFHSLLNIADCLYLGKHPYEDIEEPCIMARIEAQKLDRDKLEVKAIKQLMSYQEAFGFLGKMDALKADLKRLGLDPEADTTDEESDANTENTPSLGDDICIEDITDISDNEEDADAKEKSRTARRRGKTFSIKKNIKGETQLHQAAISGNKLLAEKLIAQGHPVNVRDNAGWSPLHEACIHGNVEIVEMLLEKGANVNDKGGTQCDGITPIYDAACNGHLEIIELLLDRGASPIIKTDFGETPLDALSKWRKSASLDSREEVLYDGVFSKIRNCLEKAGTIANKKSSPGTSTATATPIKNRNDCDLLLFDSDDDVTPTKSSMRSRAIINDDSSSNSNDSINATLTAKRKKSDGVSEYRNAILSLRNRRSDESTKKGGNEKKKSALLDSAEVVDEWLDDDLNFQTNKKRKTNECNAPRSIDPDDEILDIQMENIDPSPLSIFGDRASNEGSQEKKKKSKLKFQTTLLKSGFSRRKSSSPVLSPINLNAIEPDSTTEQIDLDSIFSGNDSNLQRFDGLNRNFASAPRTPQKNVAAAPAAVKVRIMDKLLLIPVNLDTVNSHQIKWLAEEVSRRYYNIEGVKPTLNLLTSDGALLAEEDPLSLVFTSSELMASVTNWNMPPVGERYIEYCQQFKIEVDMDFRKSLDSSQATHILNLSNQSLQPSHCHPILKAINHQPNLYHLDLSNNCLGIDGMKLLTQCLPTLKVLRSLNVSGNGLCSDAVYILLEMFEKSQKSILQNLDDINFSYNDIKDIGLRYLLKITNFIQIKHLDATSCGIEDNSISPQDTNSISLAYLESLTIANNRIGIKTFPLILSLLNASLLSRLDVSGLTIGDKLGEILSAFVDAGQGDVKLKELNLSRCGISDVGISHLLRSLSTSRHFKKLLLQYNNELSVISLKKLIQHTPAIEEIDLEGCYNIFKYSQVSDFETIWFKGVEWGGVRYVYLTTAQSTNEEKGYVDQLCNMWQCFWKHKSTVTRYPYGGLKLSTNE